jgi:arsenate reductase (glutaredoxin)
MENRQTMNLTIYHNPSCSKSRKSLELIEEQGITPKIVEYLQTPPDADTVLALASQLGVRVIDLLRPAEDDFAALTKDISTDNDAALAARLKSYPRALQRPIVVNEDTGEAVIGRPPENVLGLLQP